MRNKNNISSDLMKELAVFNLEEDKELVNFFKQRMIKIIEQITSFKEVSAKLE